jgi:ppGpp synthetase/RelA/SpoT-type nucleotidyltranferase
VIIPVRILNKYRSVEPYFEIVRKLVREPLTVLCDGKGYALMTRIKSAESVAEKVETCRYKDWAQIDDLVGFAVVIPTLTDEATVIAYLDEIFERVGVRARGSTLKAPDVFRFDCTRFIGRLRPRDEETSGPVHHLKFEIQIRSAFDHAWSVTTHALAYKTQDINWNKLRLTAQLKAAVEQLDLLVLAFEQASLKLEPSVWPEIKAKQQIMEYFSSVVEKGLIPNELSPKVWSRFTDNVFRLIMSSSGSKKPKASDIPTFVKQAVDAELAQVGAERVPRSVSLWQFAFASLYKTGMLSEPGRDYWPLITPELEDFYPELRTFAPRFDYS